MSVNSVVFSPDGGRIVSGSRDQTLKLWDAITQNNCMTLQNSNASCIAYSPDSKRLASGGWNNTVGIWSSYTGEELHTLLGHTGSVYSVAFSPDGVLLASGSKDKTIKLWNVASGKEAHTLVGHTAVVRSVAFSNDGTRLASCGDDETIRLWDTATGKELLNLSEKFQNKKYGVAFSPDNSRLANYGEFGIRLWDVVSGKELQSIRISSIGRVGYRLSNRDFFSRGNVVFSPDGKRLVSEGENYSLKIWDAFAGRERCTLEGHTNSVFGIAFSSDGSRLISASLDGTIRLWDSNDGQELLTVSKSEGEMVDVSISPDGAQLASCGLDGVIRLWSMATQETLVLNFPQLVEAVVISANENLVAVGSAGISRGESGWYGDLTLWETVSGKQILTRTNDRAALVFAISHDEKKIVYSEGLVAKIWDVSGQCEIPFVFRHRSTITSMDISPNGEFLVTSSFYGEIKVWDISTGALVHAYDRKHEVQEVTFSSDGSIILLREKRGHFMLETATGRQLKTEFNRTTKTARFSQFQTMAGNQPTSASETFLAIGLEKEVFLVDKSFKNTPKEKAFRDFKSRLRPVWHREQAAAAESAKNWYTAIFHRAWLLKADPDSAEAYDALHASHEKWRASVNEASQQAADSSNVAAADQPDQAVTDKPPVAESGAGSSASPSDPNVLMSAIVREMLLLPRGTKLSPQSTTTPDKTGDLTGEKKPEK